jgi:hypothetical protein
MPKDEIKAMYKAEGAGFLNVSEIKQGIIMKLPSKILSALMRQILALSYHR